MGAMKLSDGVAEWLEHRAVNAGMSAGTLKADRESLARFQSVVGDIYIHNVDGRHITKALLELGYAGPKASIGPGARNNFTGKLNVFFNYALNVRWTKQNPMALVPNVKNPQKQWRLFPVSKFGALLDNAADPRDRGVLATALYLFLRQGEISTLRVGDVDLDRGEILITVWKKGGTQEFMPICRELDNELRRWFIEYQSTCGELDRNWFLFPARVLGKDRVRRADGTFATLDPNNMRLDPTSMALKLHLLAQDALAKTGFTMRNPRTGDAMHEGMHTLRRAGARALFDVLVEDSYDGALRVVQAMLHHSLSSTTEIYLGLTLDKQKRDDLLRGKVMFPTSDNVVSLRRAEGNG